MTNIEITYDKETGYYDWLILSKWIATQVKSLDNLIKNFWEAISLSKNQEFLLTKFNISFNENYVNI